MHFTKPSLHNVAANKKPAFGQNGQHFSDGLSGQHRQLPFFEYLSKDARSSPNWHRSVSYFLVEDIDVTCRHETWHSKSSRRGTGNSRSYKKDPQYSPIKVSYPSTFFASLHTSTRMRCSHTHFGQIIG